MLRDVGSSYRDGGEERVLEILRASSDVSSTSDELIPQAQNWAEHYHLAPTRSHLLRPLRLPADAVVLEVGAGCGAVTRYLGETCATVDAIEPVPRRAVAARERTRDLPNVEVFVGEISDIPDIPAYDVIVVVGVLEYVGSGSADLAPYREFLDGLASRLKPEGALVLAIENKLGVKYFSGSAEDHTNRYFDGPEGYPEDGPARTFSRRELTDLLSLSGLTAETVLAFPDYKMPRALLSPERLGGEAESLLYRVPNFPSPDWVVPRETVADERLVWRSFVQAGLAADTGNSFVALAGKSGLTDLWDPEVGGVFYSVDRRSAYAVETRIVTQDGEVRLDRTRLVDAPWTDDLSVLTGSSPFEPGRDLVEVFVDTDDPDSVAALKQWKAMVEEADTADGLPLDLVPHNLVVREDGSLVAIDDEWRLAGGRIEDVLRRGVLTLGVSLALRGRSRAPWAGCENYREVTTRIGAAVGLTEPGWLERAVAAEAARQARISLHPAYLTSEGDAAAASAKAFNNILEIRLDSQLRFGVTQANLRASAGAMASTGETADSLRHQLHLARVDAHELRIAADNQRLDLSRQLTEARGALIEAADEVEHHRTRTGALDTRIEALERERAQQVAVNTVLRSEVEHFRNDVRDLSKLASDTAGELERTRATLSWRVTAPLRWVRGMGR